MKTTRLRSGSALSLALGAVLALACVVFGGASAGAAAMPQATPMTFTFANLLPGTPQTQQQVFQVPVDSDVTSVVLRPSGPAGAVTWHARLCPDSGACVDLVDGTAAFPLTAGTYAVTVSATALTLQPGEVSALEGQLVLVESAGWLAATGSDLVWPLLAAATALLAGGAFLVVVARRHSRSAQARESTC